MEFAFQDVEELAFTSVGAVCLHPEEELPQAAGNSQLVAASSLFGLVFFSDGLGACVRLFDLHTCGICCNHQCVLNLRRARRRRRRVWSEGGRLGGSLCAPQRRTERTVRCDSPACV